MPSSIKNARLQDIRNTNIHKNILFEYPLERVELPESLRTKIDKRKKANREVNLTWKVPSVRQSQQNLLSNIVLQNKILQLENPSSICWELDFTTEEYIKYLTIQEKEKFEIAFKEKIKDITTKIKNKYSTKKNQLDEQGIFHPEINERRIQSMYLVELQRKLDLKSIRFKLINKFKEISLKRSESFDLKTVSNSNQSPTLVYQDQQEILTNSIKTENEEEKVEKEDKKEQLDKLEKLLNTNITSNDVSFYKINSQMKQGNNFLKKMIQKRRGDLIVEDHDINIIRKRKVSNSTGLNSIENNSNYDLVQLEPFAQVSIDVATSLLTQLRERLREKLLKNDSTLKENNNLVLQENSFLISKTIHSKEDNPLILFQEKDLQQRKRIINANFKHQKEEINNRRNIKKENLSTIDLVENQQVQEQQRISSVRKKKLGHSVSYSELVGKKEETFKLRICDPKEIKLVNSYNIGRHSEQRLIAKNKFNQTEEWKWEEEDKEENENENEKEKEIIIEESDVKENEFISSNKNNLQNNNSNHSFKERYSISQTNRKGTTVSLSLRTQENEKSLQERIENVWKQLETPFTEKLLLMEKYSDIETFALLSTAITYWEDVAFALTFREKLLNEQNVSLLDQEIHFLYRFGFEQQIIDEYKKDSICTEEKFNYLIERVTVLCTRVIQEMIEKTGDSLTYEGISYMKRIESKKIIS